MNRTIYIIKNQINQKVYIGQTIQEVEVRFSQHLKLLTSNKNQAISKAIKSLGKENFYYEVLEENIESDDLLNKKEEFYIKKFNSMVPNGYNISPGGAKWKKSPKLTSEQAKEVICKYKSGDSARKIGSQYGISHFTVLKIVKKADVKARDKNHSLPDRTSKVTEEIMEELYLNKKMSIKEIAEKLDVCTETVNFAKRRYKMDRIKY